MRFTSGKPETVCGIGSTRKSAEPAAAYLKEVIDKYGIKSIADAGCGDMNWMRYFNLGNVEYCGYDEERHLSNYPLPWRQLDIRSDLVAEADLIICRDVFLHLPHHSILECLDRFVESGSKYLLTNGNSGMHKAGYAAVVGKLGEPPDCSSEANLCLWTLGCNRENPCNR